MITRCTVLQMAAIDHAIKTPRQYNLLAGRVPWGRRDRPFLERLRNVRGLNIIEDHNDNDTSVTIAGTLRPDGFTRVIKENSNG
jgi:hypothetical protein